VRKAEQGSRPTRGIIKRTGNKLESSADSLVEEYTPTFQQASETPGQAILQ
jgi:hypothetical protein